MKQLKKIIFPFIVFYSLALFSCSKDNSQTVYVGDFTFREPPASLWQKADESQKNSIQEWTIGGIKNYPQYMYIHNETGSTFVVSTIYFENSDPADIEETVSVYMKEFEKILSFSENVTAANIETEGDLKVCQIAFTGQDSITFVRTLYYSINSVMALSIDLYTKAEIANLLKDDISFVLDGVGLAF